VTVTLPEQVIPARYLRLYDRVFQAGRWRSVISADLRLPPTDDEIASLRASVTEASDDLSLMEAAFALGYAIKNRRKWPVAVVIANLGTAGTTYTAEYKPDEMVTVRRPST
jgi:hypothetical protein